MVCLAFVEEFDFDRIIFPCPRAGRVALDRAKLKIPIVGRVIHDYAQNRFTRTLGTMIASDVPMQS